MLIQNKHNHSTVCQSLDFQRETSKLTLTLSRNANSGAARLFVVCCMNASHDAFNCLSTSLRESTNCSRTVGVPSRRNSSRALFVPRENNRLRLCRRLNATKHI